MTEKHTSELFYDAMDSRWHYIILKTLEIQQPSEQSLFFGSDRRVQNLARQSPTQLRKKKNELQGREIESSTFEQASHLKGRKSNWWHNSSLQCFPKSGNASVPPIESNSSPRRKPEKYFQTALWFDLRSKILISVHLVARATTFWFVSYTAESRTLRSYGRKQITSRNKSLMGGEYY